MTEIMTSQGSIAFARSISPPAPRINLRDRARERTLLEAAAREDLPDAILLSGGLDSTLYAHLARDAKPKAYVVLTPAGMDRPYARAAADSAGLELRVIELTLDEVAQRAEEITRIERTFDPMEVRNSVIQFIGMERALKDGASLVGTGDGADELYAGYSYMTSMPPAKLTEYRQYLASRMTFASAIIAKTLRIRTTSPFLHEVVRAHVVHLHNECLVGRHQGRAWGKWILREAFVGRVPAEILWRWKDPLEVGSGTAHLPSHLAREKVSSFARLKQRGLDEGVVLRDAEHAMYYEAYRRDHAPPRDLDPSTRTRCPSCHGPANEDSTFCKTCGSTIEPTEVVVA